MSILIDHNMGVFEVWLHHSGLITVLTIRNWGTLEFGGFLDLRTGNNSVGPATGRDKDPVGIHHGLKPLPDAVPGTNPVSSR